MPRIQDGHCCRAHPHPLPQHASPLLALPDHVLELVVSRLAGGSRDALRLSCRALRAASNRLTTTLDLYELCGWGDGSQNLPAAATAAAQRHPNITSLVLPTGWRQAVITKLLSNTSRYPGSSSSSTSGRTWRQLAAINIHFHALSPAAAASLARFAPGLTRLTLSLDLAYEATNRQAWRIASLHQLPSLRSLVLAGPDLRPEALQVLSCLRRLSQLLLLGPSSNSHPAGSISALAGLSQLQSLSFHWQAGRSLTDGSGLARLSHLQELQLWLGASREFPPCSSKPLPGMLEALGRLGRLTQLQLLQGLHLSWDLRQLGHLAQLQQLQVLGLHDSVLSEGELALLAPCCRLHTMQTDTLRLPAGRSPPAAPEAEAAADMLDGGFAWPGQQPGAAAAAPLPAGGGAADPVAGALLVLRRLRRLQVNMLQLGVWQLAEVAPLLTHLGPLEATLGVKGHGVVWDLGALSCHPRLQSLGLMLGALGSTCSCHRSLRAAAAASAESLAAAVVRVLLESAGIARAGGGPRGCSVQQLLAVLRSLPELRQLQLWGNAGGCSGRLLASLDAAASRSSSSSGGSGGASSSSSSSRSSRSCSAAGLFPNAADAVPMDAQLAGAGTGGSGGVVAVVGDLLSSFGALLSPRGQQPAAEQPVQATATAVAGCQDSVTGPQPAAGEVHNSTDAVASWKEPSSSHSTPAATAAVPPVADIVNDIRGVALAASTSSAAGAGLVPASCSCELLCSAEYRLVVQLLQGLPTLQALQLQRWAWLPEGGRQLAAATCGRFGCQAAVEVLHTG